MESKNTSISGLFVNKQDAATFAKETLDRLLQESTDITSVSITITIPEKSEDYCVDIVTA